MGGSRPPEQGNIFIQLITGPGVGLPINIIPTLSQVWRVKGIAIMFRTDATVANRQVSMYRTDGTEIGAQIWSNFVQTASLNRTYNFVDWFTGVPWVTLSHIMMPFNGGSLISAAQYLVITSDNLQAGDEFSFATVDGEKWLED